jgi:hypothetical protein
MPLEQGVGGAELREDVVVAHHRRTPFRLAGERLQQLLNYNLPGCLRL